MKSCIVLTASTKTVEDLSLLKAIRQVSYSMTDQRISLLMLLPGYGFHGDFLNGWDEATLTAALSQCAAGDKNPSGVVGSCPVFAPMNDQDFATNCPARLPLIDEPVLGMIDKLPGCITITEGPASATAADMVCGTDTTQPSMSSASSESGTTVGAEVNGWKYLGCANEPTNARALDGASMIDGNLTNGVCQAWCSKKGFTMAGTEYASQCYCGNSLATGSSLGAKCKSIKCAGSDAEYCGGPDRLSVYQKSS